MSPSSRCFLSMSLNRSRCFLSCLRRSSFSFSLRSFSLFSRSLQDTWNLRRRGHMRMRCCLGGGILEDLMRAHCGPAVRRADRFKMHKHVICKASHALVKKLISWRLEQDAVSAMNQAFHLFMRCDIEQRMMPQEGEMIVKCNEWCYEWYLPVHSAESDGHSACLIWS